MKTLSRITGLLAEIRIENLTDTIPERYLCTKLFGDSEIERDTQTHILVHSIVFSEV
jgi:hypothetical protein